MPPTLPGDTDAAPNVGLTTPTSSRLFGVLVTFRRPQELAAHLESLAQQTRRLDHLVVVDNAPGPELGAILAANTAAAPVIDYLPMAENSGPAGGLARGMRRVLDLAAADDWVMLLDDDDPPATSDMVERLSTFAAGQLALNPNLGMVGLVGARFNFRRGRIVRLHDDELHGAVAVDYVGGSQLPMVRVSALRSVGPFAEELFFGLDDLEFGLRLRRKGNDIVIDGALAHWGRVNAGRLGPKVGSAQWTRTAVPPWRRYYSLRNLIIILRRHGRRFAAVRVSLGAGLAKGVVLLVVNPRRGLPHFTASVRAVVHGWRGRLGRTVDPPAASKAQSVSPTNL